MVMMRRFRVTGEEKRGEGEGGMRVELGGTWGRGLGEQDVREVHLAMKLKRKCNAIQGK